MFQNGIKPAVRYAEMLADAKEIIYAGENISYPKILAFSDLSPKEYIETVQYTNYPATYLNISQCGNYVFNVSAEGNDGIYIIRFDQTENYVDMGYTVEQFGNIAVVYK